MAANLEVSDHEFDRMVSTSRDKHIIRMTQSEAYDWQINGLTMIIINGAFFRYIQPDCLLNRDIVIDSDIDEINGVYEWDQDQWHHIVKDVHLKEARSADSWHFVSSSGAITYAMRSGDCPTVSGVPWTINTGDLTDSIRVRPHRKLAHVMTKSL